MNEIDRIRAPWNVLLEIIDMLSAFAEHRGNEFAI